MSFWLHGCCGEWEGGPVNQVNHTSWVAVVTPTDRPKSVRNCCLIELFCGVVCVVTLPFWHFCWCRGFVIGLGQISSFLSWSIKNSSEVIEKLRLRNFQGSQVSSFDFSILYTSLPHDLIKAKVLSHVNWWFNSESKTYLCTSDKARFFNNKKYDTYKCWTCSDICEAFTFRMENIYEGCSEIIETVSLFHKYATHLWQK